MICFAINNLYKSYNFISIKIKYKITLICGLISTIVFSQEYEFNWRENLLNGKVKFVKTITYQTFKKNGQIVKGQINNHLDSHIAIFFNEKGNKTRFEYRPVSNTNFYTTMVYLYDNDGILKERKQIRKDNNTIYEISFYTKTKNQWVETIYNCIECEKKEVSHKNTYTYNNYGDCISIKQEDFTEHQEYKQTLKYNSDRKLVYFNTDFGRIYTYFYDEKGNLTKMQMQEDDYTETEYYTYLSFDNYGNWLRRIQKITFNNDLKDLIYIQEREIEYYLGNESNY